MIPHNHGACIPLNGAHNLSGMRGFSLYSYYVDMLKKTLIDLIPFFTKNNEPLFKVLLVYAENIILAGNSLHEFSVIKSILH